MDRLEDIHSSRKFPTALEVGSYKDHILDILCTSNSNGIEHLVQLRTTVDEKTLYPPKVNGQVYFYDLELLLSSKDAKLLPSDKQIRSYRIQHDMETIPFKEQTFDLVLSSFNLHWVNNLPLILAQIRTALKPDGVFLGSLLGGNTLKVSYAHICRSHFDGSNF